MQAIEFNSKVEHGQIAVPEALHLAEGQPIRVVILLDEVAEVKGADNVDGRSVWERTAGAWQGEELVRELQGSSEVAQMKVSVSHLKDSDLQKAPQALMHAAGKSA